MTRQNRAILLTAPSSAAIAVVRLIGPGVVDCLRRHFTKPAVSGRCIHGQLRDGVDIIDDPVVILAEDGSFADINLHGGPWVVRMALNLAGREGFEVIDRPGSPAPLDAVDGQTLLEREVGAYLSMARTELGLRMLLAQPEVWREVAAGAKGPSLQAILDDRSLFWLLHPPRVAIVGAANVGKSTLANQLFAQERSITADLPGTTRDWVGEMANLDGLAVMLIDTPGSRATDDAIEQAAIRRSREEVGRADLVVAVLDVTMPLELQRHILDTYPQAIRVANKSDRPSAWDIADAIATVATGGVGVKELRAAVCRRFECYGADLHRPRVWTERQREIVRRAVVDPAAINDLWACY